jgi:uncharacterized membrane protein YraQ (UPF0718 family)
MNVLYDAILKMTWLSDGIAWILTQFGLQMDQPLVISLHYFIYDTIKIFILLSVLIYTISYIQSYFPPERTRKILGRFNGFFARLLAALLGTITPFCSCSSIPLFIGFTKAGLNVGVTFSFLISSPLVDLASVFLLMSVFNPKVAIAYVSVGLLLAVIGGTLISWLKMERYVEPFVLKGGVTELDEEKMTHKDRHNFSKDQVMDIVRKVWIYILVGVLIGALIHDWIPASWIQAVLGEDKWYSVPLAVLVGVPMYADIFGTLPIAEALVSQGVGLGTVLAFMMAVTTLSLPSIILLKKVVKKELLILFVVYCTIGIMIIGYVFNAIQGILI